MQEPLGVIGDSVEGCETPKRSRHWGMAWQHWGSRQAEPHCSMPRLTVASCMTAQGQEPSNFTACPVVCLWYQLLLLQLHGSAVVSHFGLA